MSETAVLDASALLAYLQEERGADAVLALLQDASISAVNWSEVIQKTQARGGDATALRIDMESLGLQVVPFDAEDAEVTASLWPVTRAAGLSLADRACLALARRLGAPALTAETAWTPIAHAAGVEVEVIREGSGGAGHAAPVPEGR